MWILSIIDATHTKARYNQKTPRELLQDQSKRLRKSVYDIEMTMKEEFPTKNIEDSLYKEIDYCNKLIKTIKDRENLCPYPKVSEKLNLLKKTVQDDIEHLQCLTDTDAKAGHKITDSSFFGYKTHIVMTEERIITAATITTGERNNGKELNDLYHKSKKTGQVFKSFSMI